MSEFYSSEVNINLQEKEMNRELVSNMLILAEVMLYVCCIFSFHFFH